MVPLLQLSMEKNISYAVYDKMADCIFLTTEIEEGYSIRVPIEMRKLFIIPEISRRTDAKLIHKCSTTREKYELAKKFPESIFIVADYGIIQKPIFKGCNFSNSLVDIAIQKFDGEVYSISFKVGDGVHGCDKIVDGSIPNSYTMNPIGIMGKNEKLIISI